MHSCHSLGRGWPGVLPEELLPQETGPTLACVGVSLACVPSLPSVPFYSQDIPLPWGSHPLSTLLIQGFIQGRADCASGLNLPFSRARTTGSLLKELPAPARI